MKLLLVVWILCLSCLSPLQVWSQTASEEAKREKGCSVSKEELQIYWSNLRLEWKYPQVVETTTALVRLNDLDTLNLLLAAQARAIPPEIRTNFKERNRSQCSIPPVANIKNTYFISKTEADELFKRNNGSFEKKYGKDADILVFSRVGFSADRTLALVHVSGGTGGTLYYYERKNDKWVVKWSIATWAAGATLGQESVSAAL